MNYDRKNRYFYSFDSRREALEFSEQLMDNNVLNLRSLWKPNDYPIEMTLTRKV